MQNSHWPKRLERESLKQETGQTQNWTHNRKIPTPKDTEKNKPEILYNCARQLLNASEFACLYINHNEIIHMSLQTQQYISISFLEAHIRRGSHHAGYGISIYFTWSSSPKGFWGSKRIPKASFSSRANFSLSEGLSAKDSAYSEAFECNSLYSTGISLTSYRFGTEHVTQSKVAVAE